MADAPDAPAPPNTAAGAGTRRPMRRDRRILLTIGAVLVALVAVAVVAVVVVTRRAQPPQPGAFYAALSPLPGGPPGTLIRSEPLQHVPAEARGWIILYLSTSYTGKPVAVSGLVIVPTTAAPAGGRRVVAWAHGTVGVASGCAPSLQGSAHDYFIDGLPVFLKAGYAVVATDYLGLGTPGPHPYLVGKAEAIAVLDSVRAARHLSQVHAGTTFAVWGASQGGHAALFTGQYAASYAPELRLVGVAAAAPATALIPLFERKIGSDFGNLLSAYTLDTWAQVYPALRLDQVVTATARPFVRTVATHCLVSTSQALPALLHAQILKIVYLHKLPWDSPPWQAELDANTPAHTKIPAPLFIGQGAADPLIHPDLQAAFVSGLCKAGEAVEYRTYPGVGHVDAGPAVAPAAEAWIAARFAGKAAPTTCS